MEGRKKKRNKKSEAEEEVKTSLEATEGIRTSTLSDNCLFFCFRLFRPLQKKKEKEIKGKAASQKIKIIIANKRRRRNT